MYRTGWISSDDALPAPIYLRRPARRVNIEGHPYTTSPRVTMRYIAVDSMVINRKYGIHQLRLAASYVVAITRLL